MCAENIAFCLFVLFVFSRVLSCMCCLCLPRGNVVVVSGSPCSKSALRCGKSLGGQLQRTGRVPEKVGGKKPLPGKRSTARKNAPIDRSRGHHSLQFLALHCLRSYLEAGELSNDSGGNCDLRARTERANNRTNKTNAADRTRRRMRKLLGTKHSAFRTRI